MNACLEPAEMICDALEGKRVLLVEDNGLLGFVLEETLREAGCEVIGPFGGLHDAMRAANARCIDVALLDINLRGELVSPLAHQLRERRIPFLLTSAYHCGDLPRALQSAAQLRKPFTDADLLSGLATVLQDEPRRD
jgi:DNA-binding response OmpR family regulator